MYSSSEGRTRVSTSGDLVMLVVGWMEGIMNVAIIGEPARGVERFVGDEEKRRGAHRVRCSQLLMRRNTSNREGARARCTDVVGHFMVGDSRLSEAAQVGMFILRCTFSHAKYMTPLSTVGYFCKLGIRDTQIDPHLLFGLRVNLSTSSGR
jgi:hypothetical protein